MADFVAVIRRAVDGLSDNNAEMRQKVYDKARGAVRRQLESMNPRPSDDLMKRQLDKLEAAIDSVEGDHAEALPIDEPPSDHIAEFVPVEVADAPPAAEDPVPVADVVEEPAIVAEEHDPAPVVHDVADLPQPAEPEVLAEEPLAAEHEASDEEPVQEPFEEPHQEQVFETAPQDQAPPYDEPVPETEPPVVEAHSEPAWQVEARPSEDYVPSWQDDRESEPQLPVTPAGETAQDFDPEPQHDYAVHDVRGNTAEPVAEAHMAHAETQWEWNGEPAIDTPADKPVPASDVPDLLAWEWPQDKTAEIDKSPEKTERDAGWGDLDDLLGAAPAAATTAAAVTKQSGDSVEASPAIAGSSVTADTTRTPQRSFQTEQRKSGLNLGALAATVALVAAVGGAGAAYWFNRDTVNGWVSELVASVSSPAGEDQPGDTGEGTRDLSSAETTPATSGNAAGGTEVAAVTPASGGKFTQRLLADGTEVDSGPAPALGGAAEEGKSVAAQTTESAEASGGAVTPPAGEETADGTSATPAGGTTAAGTGTDTPAAGGEQVAGIGVTQKMFLYEERLGQTSPTAIEGTVAWSSAEESPGGDTRPEPVVRAQINVPSKGLTALVTFRRNADQSLPASHIIELVFSLPENFEGGGIESVQRVAMKRTEQDRGDALIAVPAKITDDFHMIALNDFPEAIAKNVDLLRTRPWIDIPITYRNGRRALLTLDKGTAGSEAFDQVMRSWSAAGNSQ